MRNRALLASVGVLALGVSFVSFGSRTSSQAATVTTAWHGGAFGVDVANVVRQSDIVLGRANTAATQSMPLGNGTLGVAVWAAGGFTAQLNRSDTLPGRKSPGQVNIPGLSVITNAPDFHGYLDPYNGQLYESGGGMSATIYVRADKDELVVDVTGANPAAAQTATISLWSGRSPAAAASGAIATLAETWADNIPTTGSGQTFGSLAALTAGGRSVTASVVNSSTVRVSFTPNADGSFRVIVGAPRWSGGNAASTAAALLGSDPSVSSPSLAAAHLAWWHAYWAGLGLITLSSSDGSANYLQNVRTLYYFTEAESSRGPLPGSQAGVADLFNFSQDHQDWYPAAFWFWNLRGQVAANIGAGESALNAPVFNLYTSNLSGIEAWTRANMGGRPGICVPETMRFNGNGYQNDSAPTSDASCDQNIAPTWNGETVTTGAEIGLWVWQQYQTTGDLAFLSANYPLMSQAAQFLLAYATKGSDGLLHAVANAHETQWNVQDPTTDMAAMGALFPATIQAAQLLGTDATLVSELKTAETELPPYARTDEATHTQLLTPSADASGTDVIGTSYQPTAAVHNVENIGLEPVWPYGLIGDQGPLTALAQRTFTHRVTSTNPDWSFDAVHAARLGLSAQVAPILIALTERYQAYPDGLGSWQGGTGNEPYIEQPANVALAINESLVQDYDGLLRIAPALPAGWNAAGTQYIHGGSKVSVQVQAGVITTVGINAGSTGTIEIRNPWPGQQVEVVNGGDETTVIVAPTTASQFAIPATAGHSYLVQPVANPVSALPVATVTGTPATAADHLGNATIGLDPATRTGTGPITGYHGLCVDDSGAGTANGNPIIVYTCNGAAGQQWTVAPDGELHTLGGCMTASAAASNSPVQFDACTGATSQLWTHQANGELINTASGLCLDDTGSGGSGTQLIVWTCKDSPNQIWTRP